MSTLLSARRVVVTQRFFDAQARAFLEQHGCTVSEVELPAGVADGDLGVDVLRRHLEGAQGWIVGHARVDDELLRALPALRVIARRGVSRPVSWSAGWRAKSAMRGRGSPRCLPVLCRDGALKRRDRPP